MNSFYGYFPQMQFGGGSNKKRKKGSTFSGNLFYQTGGEQPKKEDYPDDMSYNDAMMEWLSGIINSGGSPNYVPPTEPVSPTAGDLVAATNTPIVPAIPELTPYTGLSVVDFLKLQGASSDLASRKKMAKVLGINDYKPDAYGNKKLMEAIMQYPEVIEDFRDESNRLTQAALDALSKKVIQKSKPKVTKTSTSSYFPGIKSAYDLGPIAQAATLSASKTPIGKGVAQKIDPYSEGLIESDIRMRGPIVNDQMNRDVHNAILDSYTQTLGNAAMLAAPQLVGRALGALTTRTYPYNPLQLPGRGPITNPARLLEAPATPRGWEIPSQGLRSPGYPMYDDGGQWGGTYIPEYSQMAYGGYHSEIPRLFNQPVDRMNKAMYGMGMKTGGQMPQWLAERRFTAAGNRDMMSDYGYATGGEASVGDEMEVTPEQLEMLKQQGYKFEIIG